MPVRNVILPKAYPVIDFGTPRFHLPADAQADILAAALIFRLVYSGRYLYNQRTKPRIILIRIIEIHITVMGSQIPAGLDHLHSIPSQAAGTLDYDKVDFTLHGVLQHPAVFHPLAVTSGGNIQVNVLQLPEMLGSHPPGQPGCLRS